MAGRLIHKERRDRDNHRVRPDGEYAYKGDAYYGYDEETEPKVDEGWVEMVEDSPAIKAQEPDQSTQEP